MQILAVGMGQWNGAVVRASNPQRRDVQMMPPATKTGTPSYLVVQWTVDNSSMGLVVNVMEKVDVARANLKGAGGVIKKTSEGWDSWVRKTGPLLTGIDSGL